MRVEAVDYHTGGEPFRIVTGGVETPRGSTILDRRRDALERLDHVRRFLIHEPRGHADMYGCHVVPPNDDGADLGVVFFHNAGYSTACGHGTIALVTWALDEGILERARGREPRRRRRPVRPARDLGARRERPRSRGPVPERPRVRLGRRAPGRRTHRRPRVRRRLLRVARGACPPAGAPAPHRARSRAQAPARSRARGRPSPRARAPRRLRRDLLAGGARGAR